MKKAAKKFISFLMCLCLILTVTGFSASVTETACAQTVEELNEELKKVDEQLEILKAQDVDGKKLPVVGAAHLSADVAHGSGTHHDATIQLVVEQLAVEVEQQ